jgi:hypothetical protein
MAGCQNGHLSGDSWHEQRALPGEDQPKRSKGVVLPFATAALFYHGLDPKMHGEVRCSGTPTRPVLSSVVVTMSVLVSSQGLIRLDERKKVSLSVLVIVLS